MTEPNVPASDSDSEPSCARPDDAPPAQVAGHDAVAHDAAGAAVQSCRIQRTLAAERDAVWRHLTEPELLERWFCPNPGLELSVEVDPRVGGRYRADMGGEHVAVGEYTEVEPGARLAFTWSWAHEPDAVSLVTISLADADGGTQLALVHSGLADAGDAEGHAEGWELSLERLDSALA